MSAGSQDTAAGPVQPFRTARWATSIERTTAVWAARQIACEALVRGDLDEDTVKALAAFFVRVSNGTTMCYDDDADLTATVHDNRHYERCGRFDAHAAHDWPSPVGTEFPGFRCPGLTLAEVNRTERVPPSDDNDDEMMTELIVASFDFFYGDQEGDWGPDLFAKCEPLLKARLKPILEARKLTDGT